MKVLLLYCVFFYDCLWYQWQQIGLVSQAISTQVSRVSTLPAVMSHSGQTALSCTVWKYWNKGDPDRLYGVLRGCAQRMLAKPETQSREWAWLCMFCRNLAVPVNVNYLHLQVLWHCSFISYCSSSSGTGRSETLMVMMRHFHWCRTMQLITASTYWWPFQ